MKIRTQSTSLASWAILAALLIFPFAALAGTCPTYIQNKKIDCPQQKNARLSDACEQANRDIEEAYKIAVQACSKTAAIGTAAAKAPSDKQTDSEANANANYSNTSQALKEAAAKLNEKNENLKNDQETLKEKADQGAQLANQPTIRKRFHGGAALAAILEGANQFKQLSSSMNASEASNLEHQQSPLLSEQARTYREIAEARQAIQNEANKMTAQSGELSKNANTTADRKNGLDTQSPQGGGGSPGGGGSGGSPQASSALPTGGGPSESAATGDLSPKLSQNSDSSGTGSKTDTSVDVSPGEKAKSGSGLAGSNAYGSRSRTGALDKADASAPAGSSGYAGLTDSSRGGEDGKSVGKGSSGDSASPGSSLRSQLSKLGMGGGTGGSGGGGSGKDGKGEEGSAKEAAAGGGAGGAGGGGAGGEGGFDDSGQPFGRSLGDPKLALAGSETDDSVKKLMQDFEGAEGDRDPASLTQENDIGGMEGPTLFERLRAVHDRCMKRGLLSSTAKTTKI